MNEGEKQTMDKRAVRKTYVKMDGETDGLTLDLQRTLIRLHD